MGSEGFYGSGCQGDLPAAPAGLGLAYGVPAAFSYEGATYAEGTAVQVYVVPLESEEFAPPQAGGQGEYVEGLEGVAACRFQECTSFFF